MCREERGTRKIASETLRANTDVQGVKRGAKNEGVSSCLCETWAREKELRVG